MLGFLPLAAAGTAFVVLLAAALRGRAFAAFTTVLLGIQWLVLWGLYDAMGTLQPAAWYLQSVTLIHFAALNRPRLRSLPWRLFVTWPGHFFSAATFLAFPWAIAAGLGLPPVGWWLPYIAGCIGVVQSLRTPREVVELTIDRSDAGPDVRRFPAGRRHARSDEPAPNVLRVVQITDPHLGPFMSEERLAGICARAVAAKPDLVLLTGDFFTMEGSGTPQSLARALAPLMAMQGKVFACRGNHDLEVPEIVGRDLAAVGVRLLIDEAETVETRLGPVQVLGVDHIWRGRAEHFARVVHAHPREGAVARIVLLHDPAGFGRLPVGEADLVLSGHTHGGHVGLVSLGLNWTSIGGIARIPDHGFWSRGPDRLYVHRANGHYGFPLRIGVPSEESVLRLTLPPQTERAAAG